MKKQPIAPTGHAQSFDVHETFFSTTDARGVITAGNEVFCRTSGYARHEMIGQPHNIIRHPEMPRLVFRLLWDSIAAGRSFMGYVKNHARNGNHYWVFAVVMPIPGGYVSVRIKPTSPLFGTVEATYRRLAEVESAAIAAGRGEREAADAARDALEAELRAVGFDAYDAFSHHALNVEIKSRDAEIARRGLRLFPEALGSGGGEVAPSLRTLYGHALVAYAGINELFASLDAFASICRGIHERHAAVQTIAQDFRLNAFNAHIAAHPLGAEGLTLGTVAQVLNGHGQELSRNVGVLTTSIDATTTAVADIASNLSSARIQLEMLLGFVAEIARPGQAADDAPRLQRMVEDLRAGFTSAVDYAFAAIDAVQTRLPELVATKEQLRRNVVYLQVTQVTGRVEVSRLNESDGIQATFAGLRELTEQGKRELEQLDDIVDRLRALLSGAPATVQRVRQSLAQMASPTAGMRGAATSALRGLAAGMSPATEAVRT